jgi:predicted transposase YbfD/YdcC
MQSTTPSDPSPAVSVTPSSLMAAFATIPDPRREASVIYPLPALLASVVVALLCAHTSVLAVAEWGVRQTRELREELGMPPDRAPHQTTIHRMLAKLDGRALARALRTAFPGVVPEQRGEQGVAIDGKAHRGRHQFEEEAGSPVDILTAFCHELNLILAEDPIEQGQEQAEAELSVAPTLIEHLDWTNRVLTGDALFCQRTLCQQVRDRQGDYLLLVKGNQRTLHDHLRRTFDIEARPLLDRREVRTINKGHGRIEVRQLIATADPLALPDWPGVAQVFQLTRRWKEHGAWHRQVRYGITSLPPAIGTPRRLLQCRRWHWRIENRGHRAKDVNFGEDACLVHRRHGPMVLALLRGAGLNLLRQAGCTRIAATLRAYAQDPAGAVALVLQPPPTRA